MTFKSLVSHMRDLKVTSINWWYVDKDHPISQTIDEFEALCKRHFWINCKVEPLFLLERSFVINYERYL